MRGKTLDVSYHKSHEYSRNFQDAYEGFARKRNVSRLHHLFALTDLDGSGSITLEELNTSLRTAQAHKAFASLGIQPHQAVMVFKAFDRNGDGELSRDEFLEGLTRVCGPGPDGCCDGEIDTQLLRAANLGKHLGSKAASKPGTPTTRLPTPEVQLVSERQVQRAFVHSALSKALHPASAGVGQKRAGNPQRRL